MNLRKSTSAGITPGIISTLKDHNVTTKQYDTIRNGNTIKCVSIFDTKLKLLAQYVGTYSSSNNVNGFVRINSTDNKVGFYTANF